MRLALVQLRKDIRLFRWVLLGLAALLSLDLLDSQGVTSSTNWEFPFDSRDLFQVGALRGFGVNWIIGMIVAGCGIMTFASILQDTPHREGSFLRTRPMPASSVWIGKALFVTFFIVLPLVLTEVVNLSLHNVGAELVWAGTWERLTLVLPVIIIIAAISGASENMKSPVFALLTGYAAIIVGGGLIAIVALTGIAGPVNDGVDASAIRYGLFVLAALSVVFAIWEIRLRPRMWIRASVLGVFVIIAEFTAAFGPATPEMPGLLQAEVTEKTGQGGYHIPLDRVGTIQGNPKPGAVSLGWSISPELDGLPKHWIVRWQDCSAEMKTAAGQTYHGPGYDRKILPFPRYYNLSSEDVNSLSSMLPEGAVWESSGGLSTRKTMNYRPFDLPPTGDWWNQRVRLSIHGTANVYQWKQVADLELKPGALKQQGQTKWQILATAVKPDLNQVQVVFEQSGPGLRITSDQNLLAGGRWPADRYEFLLYDPINKLGRSVDHRSASSGTIGSHTGYQRRTAILRFQEDDLLQSGWSEHPEALRLYVFRMDYLGTFEKTIATELIPNRHRPYYGNHHSNADRISREDYLRRFDELETPAPGATRTVVGNYIHSVLQLVEAYSTVKETDAPIESLTALAADYPEVFLDGYSAADSDSRRAIYSALKNGLRPDQKSLVINRLGQQPDLAGLLIDRGWHEQAREELFALLDHHSSLPQQALKALAWFNDPKADERILREVRYNHGQNAYDIAARLPRLADRLDEVIRTRWQNRSRHYRTHGSRSYDTSLAVRHGNVEALEAFVRLLSLHNPKRGNMDHSTLIALGSMLDLPGMTRRDRYSTDKVKAALLAVAGRPFRYDPVFRKYYLADINTENN